MSPSLLMLLRRSSFSPLLVVAFTLLFPTTSFADLYQYRTKDGSTLITDTKRNDLKLVRVIEGPANSPSPTKSPKRSAARQAKLDAYRAEAERLLESSNAIRSPASTPFSQREHAFDDIIAEAAIEYNLPFSFIKAVIRVESSFQSDIISHAGAMGLMQLMPRTAELMNVRDAFDPRENIFGGTKYLRLLCNRYEGNINLILAAYNAGDGAVARYNGIPYPQTRDYVQRIVTWYRSYSLADRKSP